MKHQTIVIYTMHDTYVSHKNVAGFAADDGHEFVEIWQQKVGNLDICQLEASELTKQASATTSCQTGVLDHDQIGTWLKQPVSETLGPYDYLSRLQR
jgi:hypothetical protein